MALSFIPSILSMLITLALAYGIDRWIYFQFMYSKPLGNPAPEYIGKILGGLLLCAIWVIFSWISFAKSRRTAAVSIIFIIIGLLSFVWFPLQVVSQFWAIHLYLFQTIPANLQYTGLFIAALGFLTLLPQKQKPV